MKTVGLGRGGVRLAREGFFDGLVAFVEELLDLSKQRKQGLGLAGVEDDGVWDRLDCHACSCSRS